MSDWERIFYTSVVTIVGATIVFLVGQILSKRVIEPCAELRKAISNVRFTLSYFAPIINTPISRTTERSDEAAHALRKSSAELFALVELVPKNSFLRWLSFSSLPSDDDVSSAAKSIRGLSTYLHEGGDQASGSLEAIRKRTAKIERLLGLHNEEDT